MQISDMICCGLGELNGLWGATITAVEQMTNACKRKGALIATTNGRNPKGEKALKAAGFITIRTFHNPNTDHKLKLWFKAINQPATQKRRRR